MKKIQRPQFNAGKKKEYTAIFNGDWKSEKRKREKKRKEKKRVPVNNSFVCVFGFGRKRFLRNSVYFYY